MSEFSRGQQGFRNGQPIDYTTPDRAAGWHSARADAAREGAGYRSPGPPQLRLEHRGESGCVVVLVLGALAYCALAAATLGLMSAYESVTGLKADKEVFFYAVFGPGTAGVVWLGLRFRRWWRAKA